MPKRYGMLIDLKRCIGCHTCSFACKVENRTPVGVDWHRVITIGGNHLDTPSGVYPNVSMHWLPVPCMHCENPPCADVCPESAIARRADGIVLIDQEKCSGCQECLPACPYGVLQYNPQTEAVEKCTLCTHRIDQGSNPFCVDACVWGARVFGDLSDPESEISRAIVRKQGEVALPEEGTSPAVYYGPPN